MVVEVGDASKAPRGAGVVAAVGVAALAVEEVALVVEEVALAVDEVVSVV